MVDRVMPCAQTPKTSCSNADQSDQTLHHGSSFIDSLAPSHSLSLTHSLPPSLPLSLSLSLPLPLPLAPSLSRVYIYQTSGTRNGVDEPYRGVPRRVHAVVSVAWAAREAWEPHLAHAVPRLAFLITFCPCLHPSGRSITRVTPPDIVDTASACREDGQRLGTTTP